ncbi:hypothetical protein D3C73_1640330 [compost metagenome]
MATNMKHAQELIFGAQGLGASNFKMFPGSSRDVTPEQVAQQIAQAIEEPIDAADVLTFE